MDRHNRDTVFAFLLGAAVGGAVALLFAPASGEETRKRIRRGFDSMYEKGRNMAGRVADGARHQVDAVKAAVHEGKEAYRKELSKEV